MIASIRGFIRARRPDHVVIDVGGVGYRVFVSIEAFCRLPDDGEVHLFTHTIVRDDAIHLYGFMTEREWEAFRLLVGVSGVGPKLAMAILSGLPVEDLWSAVRAGDAARLAKTPGVGKKTAGRLVVDLAGRLPKEEDAVPGAATPGVASPVADDAIGALMNLGYTEAKAQKAVDKAMDAAGGGASIEEILRLALKEMA